MQALRVCDTMRALLETTPYLSVHSVFTHACNLRTIEGETLTLQTRGMSLVPHGCILPCDSLRELFRQNERVAVLSVQHLAGSSCDIRLTGTPRCDLRLKTHAPIAGLVDLARELYRFLPRNPPAGGFHSMCRAHDSAPLPPAQTGLTAALDSLTHWLCGENAGIVSLEKTLERMVGLGVGLTPAVDDFLLGILLLLDVLCEPRRSELTKALIPLLPRTTEVSSAMLANGCTGRYPEPLLALFSTAPKKLSVALANVAGYGHSSGHDTLCGIAFALDGLMGMAMLDGTSAARDERRPVFHQTT